MPRILILLFLLTACATRTQIATSFLLTPIETSECVWVIRNNSKFVYGPAVADAQGQDYLYLCCPSESNQAPQCLTPKWSYPTNDLQVGDPGPASKSEAKVEKPKPTAPPISGSDPSPF
jgi:hypothetical protein